MRAIVAMGAMRLNGSCPCGEQRATDGRPYMVVVSAD